MKIYFLANYLVLNSSSDQDFKTCNYLLFKSYEYYYILLKLKPLGDFVFLYFCALCFQFHSKLC